ncbi:MAG: helix-turn-helix transcriptional regulator [Bacteroidales bacterium]|nr:helix-turn-helix transcriptional regulator [Bacteroidales bacterium]
MEGKKSVVLVAPSDNVARDMKTILEGSGEFVISEVYHDLPTLAEARLGTDDPEVVVIDQSSMESRQTESSSSEGGELSAREKEILVCVAKGMLNKEIADKLCLSIYTVITHRKNITRKIGIKTVAGLTVYALLNGLIDMSSVQ